MFEEDFSVREKERLDSYLADITEYTRSHIQKLIREGNVTVNGKNPKTGLTVNPGDLIHVTWPDPKPIEAQPEQMQLSIVYEDEDICVIDKPQGMVVHPAPGHESGTLVNGLLYHFDNLSTIGGAVRPGIVHRIDRMTSGLLVVAKNDDAHQSLSGQFKVHSAGRTYLALVDGNIREDCGTVDAPIGRSRTDRKKMAVISNGRNAITHWRVLARFTTHTLVECRLETGRTHQIRVHMAYIHHPIAGDEVYGQEKNRLQLEGQALHGYRLQLGHPRTGEQMVFTSPLPAYFANAVTIAARSSGQRAEEIIKEYLT